MGDVKFFGGMKNLFIIFQIKIDGDKNLKIKTV